MSFKIRLIKWILTDILRGIDGHASDQELICALTKRENMTNDEAGIALTKIKDDFWASKTGQKLLRDRVERSFAEFIARVPAGLLDDAA